MTPAPFPSQECFEIAEMVGTYPLIIRPAFTLGGSGGGIAYNREDFEAICKTGLAASATTQVKTTEDFHLTTCLCSCKGADGITGQGSLFEGSRGTQGWSGLVLFAPDLCGFHLGFRCWWRSLCWDGRSTSWR